VTTEGYLIYLALAFYGLIKLAKIINPTICIKDLAGLAKLNKSTTTLFHNNLPIKDKIISAKIKAKSTERVSAYTSRLELDPLSDIPSITARAQEVNADIILLEIIHFFHILTFLVSSIHDALQYTSTPLQQFAHS